MSFPVHIPFAELLGLELIDSAHGESHVALSLRPELTNSWEMAHGGVVMTLLDVAMAVAARSTHPGGADASTGSVTIEMKTSFLRPGRGRLHARGRVLHRSASLVFCEAALRDAEDTLVAHASGTFKTLKGVAAPALPTPHPGAFAPRRT